MVRHADEKFDSGDLLIAHLSDPHFGSDRAADVWKLVVNELRRIDPDLYLVTGDLVHTPSRSHYNTAKTNLDNLPSSTQAPYFVCAGNHDRHWMGNRVSPLLGLVCRHPFRSLPVIVWLLSAPVLFCLLIGTRWLTWTATGVFVLAMLWAIYRLSAIFRASQANAWFNDTFDGHTVHEAPHVAPLDPRRAGDRPWKVGLFGADSSRRGRMLACGYVDAATVDSIRDVKCECDIAIFLIHHHLLSIAALEGQSPDRWRDLLNATSLKNAGRVLEALTEAHADLVLHGHEHETNFVGYSSVKPGRGPLRVVAAGSATGNDSFEGCLEDHATFNVLVLSADRSVRMRRYFRQAGRWEAEEFLLLDAATLRHSQLRRRRRHHPRAMDEGGNARYDGPREIDAEVTKSLTFTQQRDIFVHWVYTNARIKGRLRLVQPVRNSTGAPDSVRFTVSAPGMEPVILKGEAVRGEKHAWNLVSAKLPPGLQRYGDPVEISLLYRWRGGGLLTDEERSAACALAAQEPLRREGYEFAVAHAPDGDLEDDLALLELIVSLPFEYAPAEDPIVRVNSTFTAPELAQQLRVVAPGLFVLHVRYPSRGCDYQIAWRPPTMGVATTTANSLAEAAFQQAALNRGSELLASLKTAIARTAFGEPESVALYLKRDGQLRLKRVALEGNSGLSDDEQLSLLNHKSGLGRAWWGDPSLEFSSEDAEDDPKMARHLHVCLPVRFSFHTIAPPSWGVVRISFRIEGISVVPENSSTVDWLKQPTNHGRIWEMLFPAVATMVSDAFTKATRQ